MTESGKIDNRTRREFTLIGMHDRASADEQIRQICVHGARCLLGLSAVQIGGSARGYQELSAPLAIPTTAEQAGAQAVCFSLSHNPKGVSYREMGAFSEPLHPRSALVMAVQSSSPTLLTASNLAI